MINETLTIKSFSKTYANRRVLDFPGISLPAGKIYALIGPNGSGKSTFAKILSRQETPDRNDDLLPAFSGTIGYLPQKPYVFHKSLEKNLLIGGTGDASARKERAARYLNALSLSHLSKKNAASLSGGETARMAAARLLMKPYSLVFLDEPCAAMDIQTTYQAEDLIRSYQAETGCTLFLITHSMGQAERLADQALFFKDGQLIEYAPVKELLHAPKKAATREFLEFL